MSFKEREKKNPDNFLVPSAIKGRRVIPWEMDRGLGLRNNLIFKGETCKIY